MQDFGELKIKYRDVEEPYFPGHLNVRRYPNYRNIVSFELCGAFLPNLFNELRLLKSLEELYLVNINLQKIPDFVGEFENLKILYLDYNPDLVSLPKSFRKLKNLEVLKLDETGIENLPSFLKELDKLQYLYLNFTKVRNINVVSNLKNLIKLNISDTKIVELPEDINKMESLQSFCFSNTKISKLPSSFSKLRNLKILEILDSEINENIDIDISELNIETLVVNFKNSHIDFAKRLKSLRELDIYDCDDNETIDFASDLEHITKLNIFMFSNCEENIKNLSSLVNLEEVSLTGEGVKNIPRDIFTISSIKKITLDRTNIPEIPDDICNMSSLKELYLERNENFIEPPDYVKNMMLDCLEY